MKILSRCLGLDPGLADVDSETLRRYARGAQKRLTNPDFSAPPPKVDGVWENPLVYASLIQTCLEPFEAALSDSATFPQVSHSPLGNRFAIPTAAWKTLRLRLRVSHISHRPGGDDDEGLKLMETNIQRVL